MVFAIFSSGAPLFAADSPPHPATSPASQPAATSPTWPDGWLFRVSVIAAGKSPNYDLILEHSGLAQPDGRDIRIFSPDGQPVSHFIAYADPTKARIIFDGTAGPGEYVIYFGNLSAALPEIPEVADLGNKQWAPAGGYSVTSYAEVLPLTKRDILGHKLARANFEKAEAAAIAKAAEQKDPKRKTQFVRTHLLRSTDGEMGNGFYHVFRAEVNVPAAGEYQIQFGAGAASELGLLYLDGNSEPIIEGSFKTPDAFMVIATQATLNLTAGKHVFEMYTNRRTADMRMRSTHGGQLRHLDGLDSHFENAAKLTAGPIDSGTTPLADAYLAAVREWIEEGRFAHARALVETARQRFPADAEHNKLFAAEYERAGQSAYDNNWLTEGKYPSRAGVAAGAAFYPPLRMSGTTAEAPNWDSRHCSSAVSVEGRIVYGLPFQVMLARPWGVTSAVCVDDDVLYLGAKNGVLHAIYLSSGEEKWTFAGGGECLGPPLVYRGAIYYGGIDRRLYAVDAQRGRMLWNFPVGGWIEGGAAAADGRLFFGSRDGTLYAVDAALGVERWHAQLGSAVFATPTVVGGKVFVGTRAGDFHALDAESGHLLWKFAGGVEIDGGACATATRVIFGDSAGRVHCLHSDTGKPAWNEPAEIGSPIIAAPILVGEILFGGTDEGKLFGIDFANGIVGWEAPMPGNGSVDRPPIFAADTLTFTSRGRNPLLPDGKVADYRGNTASFVMGPARNDLKWTPVPATAAVGASLPQEIWDATPRLPGLLKINGLSEADGPGDIHLAWDEKYLYVNATMTANDLLASPDAENLRAGSAFTLLLDPRRDGSTVFEFTVAPDGRSSFNSHTALGIDRSDPKTKPLWSRTPAQEKQLAWSPAWMADVQAEGQPRAVNDSPSGGEVLWHVQMTIPLDHFPKVLPKVGPRGSWRINMLLTDSVKDATGRPAIKTWALCPPTATEPLGLPTRWPAAEFAPVPK